MSTVCCHGWLPFIRVLGDGCFHDPLKRGAGRPPAARHGAHRTTTNELDCAESQGALWSATECAYTNWRLLTDLPWPSGRRRLLASGSIYQRCSRPMLHAHGPPFTDLRRDAAEHRSRHSSDNRALESEERCSKGNAGGWDPGCERAGQESTREGAARWKRSKLATRREGQSRHRYLSQHRLP
jgi:hypothetical protein